MAPQRPQRPSPTEPRCARPDLAAALVDWDELGDERRSELDEHAPTCPECGPALALLQRADRWLEGRLEPQAVAICPLPEDLFDFAAGASAAPLPEPELLAVRAHVEACPKCEELVATLATPPPSPLILDGEDPAPAEEPAAAPTPPERRPDRAGGVLRRLRERWEAVPPAWQPLRVPAAAAAGLLAMALLAVWGGAGGTDAAEVAGAPTRFPAEPQLRGGQPGELAFPRGKLLALSDAPADLFSPLAFEIEPAAGATRYRVTVERVDDAFDAGERIATIESARPVVEATGELLARVGPGRYTWEAWATVDGLDVPLGRRDFEVVHDEELLRTVDAIAPASPERRAEARIALLHRSGFRHDARAIARTLPPSAERDEYLGRVPGR